ncbi:MAG: tyrosine-type recombinase/integrase [Desulfovibrionaceae bacterium]
MAKTVKSVVREAESQKLAFVWENPGVVYDRFGLSVDTAGDNWELTDPSLTEIVRWDGFEVSPELVEAFKAYVACSIETQSPRTACNAWKYFFQSARDHAEFWNYPLQMADLLGVLEAYRSVGLEYKFHWIRRWYLWCADIDIPGFSMEIGDDLMEYRVGGNDKGVAVLTNDDEFGPLDDVEFDLLRSVVENGRGSLIERVCVMLCIELGANPKSLVLLEKRDFIKHEADGGQCYYMLQVPRIKKRLAKRSVRNRKISKALGKLLEELVQQNANIYGNTYGPKSPLLVRDKDKRRLFHSKIQKRYEYHLETVDFLHIVSGYIKTVELVSPRTGKPLHLNPRRLRYTFATRLVEQGAPPQVVADALDHTDLQHVGVYYEARGKTVEFLDKALGGNPHYIGVINRFLGVVVNRDASPLPVIPGDTPTFRSLGGIGYCGASELCKVYPPLSCYLCPNFQAWKDGPHAEMLAELKSYAREFASLSGYPVPRITNQVDDVILAIEQLVRLIQEDHCA